MICCRTLIVGLLLLHAGPLFADSTRPELSARRVDDGLRIEIDGRLDETAWELAPLSADFFQHDPEEGAPASERTEVRVLRDGETLYVGVSAFDSEPDKIIARILERNRVMGSSDFGLPSFAGDDCIAILLDPFDDHRNGVIFASNPNGAKSEALITDEGTEFNTDWQSVWDVAAQRHEFGWSVEFAIPFRSLRYPHSADRPWGLNVLRMIRRKNEQVLWSSWTRQNGGFHRVSLAGHLLELDDLPRPGMNLELKPYFLAADETDEDQLRDQAIDVGLDAKYEVRPGLVLDLTLHPDFAQVEADEEQVNLTRFDLFFPEKRQFFLENAGIFEFGFRGAFEPPPFLLFFSRRIGIDEDEGEVPVIGGARLTGRVGRQTIGLLDGYTEDAYGQPETNFAVARVKRDLGESSYIGLIATDRRNRATANSGVGVDFSHWLSESWKLAGMVAHTMTKGPGNDGGAQRLSADYTADRHGMFLNYLAVDPGANADMGFITRTGIRRYDLFYRFSPRPNLPGARRLNWYNLAQVVTSLGGELLDYSAGPSLELELDSGDGFGLWYNRLFSYLDEEFEVDDDLFVPVGRYHMDQIGIFGQSSQHRRISLLGSAFWQRFYDGDFLNLGLNLDARWNAHLATRLSYSFSEIDIDDGTLTAPVLGLRFGFAFTTRMGLNSLVQYNGLDEEILANLRFNYILRPGTELFLVWNEERLEQNSTWELGTRSAVLKINLLMRF